MILLLTNLVYNLTESLNNDVLILNVYLSPLEMENSSAKEAQMSGFKAKEASVSQKFKR